MQMSPRMRKRRIIKRTVIITSFSLFLFMSVYTVFERRLSNIISTISQNAVKSKAAIVISNAINEEIESESITYDTLVAFEKDSNGRITALKTNIIEINRLKANLSVRILEELAKMNTAELDIPLGTVIGGEILVGKGPGIKVNVMPVGSVETEILNEISDAGINQSRHQIMVKIKTNLTIVSSITSVDTTVETYICVAETVIVGDVPGSYTNINTSDEIFDKYNDFI